MEELVSKEQSLVEQSVGFILPVDVLRYIAENYDETFTEDEVNKLDLDYYCRKTASNGCLDYDAYYDGVYDRLQDDSFYCELKKKKEEDDDDADNDEDNASD